MTFWGVEIKPGKPTAVDTDERPLVIKQAAMASTAAKLEGSCTLEVAVGDGKKFTLCRLTGGRAEQWPLDMVFTPEEKVTFTVTGVCPVHLVGFLDQYEEDDDMFADDLDEEDSEEEEDGKAGRALGRIAAGNGNGTRRNALPGGDDEDEESDEESDDELDDDDELMDGDDESDEDEEESGEESDEMPPAKGGRADPGRFKEVTDDGEEDEDDEESEGEESEEGEEGDSEDDEDEEDSGEEDDEMPPVQQAKKARVEPPAAKGGKAATPAKPTPAKAAPASAKGTPALKTPAGAKTPAQPATTPGGSAWSAKEDAALKKSAEKHPDGTPSRWQAIAADVGGGKDKDSCKKRLRELKEKK